MATAAKPIPIPSRGSKRFSLAFKSEKSEPEPGYAYSEASSICQSPTWGYKGKDEDKIRQRLEQEKREDEEYWAQRKWVKEREQAKLESKAEKKARRAARVEEAAALKEAEKRRREEEMRAKVKRPVNRLSKNPDSFKRNSFWRSSQIFPLSAAATRKPTASEIGNQNVLGEVLPFPETDALGPFSVPATPGQMSPAPGSPLPTPGGFVFRTPPISREATFSGLSSPAMSVESPHSRDSSSGTPSLLGSSTAQTTPNITRPSTMNGETPAPSKPRYSRIFSFGWKSKSSNVSREDLSLSSQISKISDVAPQLQSINL